MSGSLILNKVAVQPTPLSGKGKLSLSNDTTGILWLTLDDGSVMAVDSEQFITTQGGTFTLVSQTTPQKLFGSPTNGALTVLGSTSFQFECFFDLTALSATSGSFGFAIGGTATWTFSSWVSQSNKAPLSTAAAPQNTVNKNSLANTAINTATTNTVGWAMIRGLLRSNVGGTLIPQVSLGVAAAAVVSQDSWFRIWPIGSSTVVSLGRWS